MKNAQRPKLRADCAFRGVPCADGNRGGSGRCRKHGCETHTYASCHFNHFCFLLKMSFQRFTRHIPRRRYLRSSTDVSHDGTPSSALRAPGAAAEAMTRYVPAGRTRRPSSSTSVNAYLLEMETFAVTVLPAGTLTRAKPASDEIGAPFPAARPSPHLESRRRAEPSPPCRVCPCW